MKQSHSQTKWKWGNGAGNHIRKWVVTGLTSDNTNRLTAGPPGSLNKPVIEEPPAPVMLLFLPWSMPPGHSLSSKLLNTDLCQHE